MTQKIINVGLTPNDGRGDTLLTAFNTTNENFTDLYSTVATLPTIGIASREVITVTTSAIAPGGTIDLDVAAHKGYVLYKIETNAACWVRIYANSALRLADSSRTIEQDPLAAAGVISEIVTSGPNSVLFTPGIYGFNAETPVTTNMPIKITNLTTVSEVFTLNLSILKTEI